MTEKLTELQAKRAELVEVVQRPTKREQAAQELTEVEAKLSQAQREADLATAKDEMVKAHRAYGRALDALQGHIAARAALLADLAKVEADINERALAAFGFRERMRHFSLDYKLPMPRDLPVLTAPGRAVQPAPLSALLMRFPQPGPSPKEAAARAAQDAAERSAREKQLQIATRTLPRLGRKATAVPAAATEEPALGDPA